MTEYGIATVFASIDYLSKLHYLCNIHFAKLRQHTSLCLCTSTNLMLVSST